MDDIYYNIFTHLFIGDIIKCSLVNKQFNKISRLDILWKYVFIKNFNNNIFKENYYETCKICIILERLECEIEYDITCEKLYKKKKFICVIVDYLIFHQILVY